MNVLFIHQAFPAQFGRLGLELNRRYGWDCRFLYRDLSVAPVPSPEMLERLPLTRIPLAAEPSKGELVPWPQVYGRHLDVCLGVLDAFRSREGPRPDLVVAHGSQGPASLFLREAYDGPIVNYCEYYFAPSHRDISYRVDLPPAEPAPFYPRCINAPALAALAAADAGYSPTRWQRDSFPPRFRPKIEVHFDGIDADLYRPRAVPRAELSALLGGRSVPGGTRVVTFVARGLESVRGFDLFLRLAGRVARERSDVVFVVVGQDRVFYGWDALHTGQPRFKGWALDQTGVDPSRFVFVDHLSPEALSTLLAASDLHVYLTAPFVPSWSLFNALACGCVVLGSDVAPVREVITDGVDGLLAPLFDADAQLDAALRVLDDPAAFGPVRASARARVEAAYGLDASVPALKDYFERVVARGPTRAVD